MTMGGWVPTEENVEKAVQDLEECLEHHFNGTTVGVYLLLDNCVFRGQGGVIPTKGKEKLYHYSILPILRAGKKHRKIVASPMQQYISAPCCSDPTHITNHSRPDFVGQKAL